MPAEMKMWRIDGDEPRTLATSAIPSERELHNFLERDPSLLGDRLLVIGSEVITPFGKRLVLLAIDVDGNLLELELKRNRTPREVVAQILDYGSRVSTRLREDVIALAERYLVQPFEAAYEGVFGSAPPAEIDGELRLTILAAQLDSRSERIVTYLRSSGVPVNAVFFSYLEDDGRGSPSQRPRRNPPDRALGARRSKLGAARRAQSNCAPRAPLLDETAWLRREPRSRRRSH